VSGVPGAVALLRAARSYALDVKDLLDVLGNRRQINRYLALCFLTHTWFQSVNFNDYLVLQQTSLIKP
jgi:hypothetical protein